MPLYVTLAKLTDQGRKTIKDLQRKTRERLPEFEKAGIKIHEFLFTTGQYDFVMIAEAANDQVVLAAALATLSRGDVSTETLHAYTVEEMEKIASKLP